MQRNNTPELTTSILQRIKRRFNCLKVKKSDYYNSIDYLPIWNWFQIMKTENIGYLYKNYNDKKCIPNDFYQIYNKMLFDFDKLELDDLRKENKEAYYRAMYYESSDKKWLNRANELKNQLKNRGEKVVKTHSVGDFLNYIELAISDLGKLDSMKLSTRRAFELYYLAKEIYQKKIKIK